MATWAGSSLTSSTASSLSVVVAAAVVALSVVVLTGIAGELSLGQYAVAGVGAAVAHHTVAATGGSGLGFVAGAFAVAQCSHDNTGPGDCHTAGSTFATVAADRTITAEIKIRTRAIGTGSAVCDAATPCSVGTVDVSDPTGPDMSRTEVTFA